MSEPKDISSLPLVTLEQAEFGLEVAVFEALEDRRGIYTAERFKQRKPEHYKVCVKLLQKCIAPSMCAELLLVDIRTVNAVVAELEASGSITPYKERTVWQLRAVITLGIDKLMDRAKAGLLSPLDIAVLIDKAELLNGGATSRVERRETAEEEESKRFFAQARSSLASLPGMVMEAEVLPEKGERQPATMNLGDAFVTPVHPNTNEHAKDSESLNSQP